jgi:hypothetical protein
MRNLNELFKHNGKIYDIEALSQELGKDLTTMTRREMLKMDLHTFHKVCDYKAPHRASFKYITLEGEKIGWQFGEKVFYDTEEERDQARKEYRLEYEAIKYRNKLLKQIQELSTEELEKIVNSL